MTAREAFKLGDLLRLSPFGRAQFKRYKGQPARVVGYGREAHLVRLQCEGRSTTQCFHMAFWELAERSTAVASVPAITKAAPTQRSEKARILARIRALQAAATHELEGRAGLLVNFQRAQQEIFKAILDDLEDF